MKRKEVKEQMDKMLLEIMKYIRAAGMDDREFYELTIEVACTFITSTIDIDQDTSDCINQYMDRIQDVVGVGIGGLIRAKENGDYKYI